MRKTCYIDGAIAYERAMNHTARALLLGSILAATTLFGAQYAAAQTGEGIQIKPAVIEDNVAPGQLYDFSFTFTNLSQSQKTFYLSALDIKGLDSNGQPIFAVPGEATGYELSTWIQIPTGPITLGADQSVTEKFTARVPSEVSPGAHFGGVFISDQPTKPSTNGSGVGLSVGGIMSLTVAGAITEGANLVEFSTSKGVYSQPEVTFDSKIQNTGNVLVRPHGIIQINDMFGHQVGSISVNDSAGPVFPASERVYTAKWQPDGFGFGQYHAVGSFSYGETDKKTISGETEFWILPWKPIALFLGSIFGVVLFLYALIRLYIRRKLRDMGIAGNRADMNFYAQRYQRSGSRLIVVTLVIFLFCVIFLSVLFFVFA